LSFSFLFHGQFDPQEIWKVSNFTQAKFSIKKGQSECLSTILHIIPLARKGN